MTKLKDSLKIERWSDIFVHSFSGMDKSDGPPSEWILVSIEDIKRSRGNFILILLLKRKDGIEANKYIRSKNKSFLQELSSDLGNFIGKSWEDIGNLENNNY